MSDQLTDDTNLIDDPATQGTETPGGKLRRELEERIRSEAEARAEAASLKKELAINKLGLDLNDAKQKYFADTFQGTPEEMAAKAQELGFTTAPTTSVPQPVIDTQNRLDNASIDATPIVATTGQEDLAAKLAEAHAKGDRTGYMALLKQNDLMKRG